MGNWLSGLSDLVASVAIATPLFRTITSTHHHDTLIQGHNRTGWALSDLQKRPAP